MAAILVLEDDDLQRVRISEILTDAGHDVFACSTADETRAQLAQERYDLLVTDIFIYEHGSVVPDGGISLIGWIRNSRAASGLEWIREMPILAISGATARPGQRFILATASTVGADDSLSKPFRPPELLKKVGDLLAKNGP